MAYAVEYIRSAKSNLTRAEVRDTDTGEVVFTGPPCITLRSAKQAALKKLEHHAVKAMKRLSAVAIALAVTGPKAGVEAA